MKSLENITGINSNKENPYKIKRLIYGICVLSWMIVIFLYSAQDGTRSSSSSSEITYFILNILTQIGIISACNYTPAQIMDFEGIIRTFAHFTEYFIFGIFTFQLARYSIAKKTIEKIMIPFLFCIIYAVTDEIHQYFVPGRAMQIEDWLVDSLGVSCGVVLFYLLTKSASNIARMKK